MRRRLDVILRAHLMLAIVDRGALKPRRPSRSRATGASPRRVSFATDDYLSGKTDKSLRHEFIYVDGDGNGISVRHDDWKETYLENLAQQLQVWREPSCPTENPTALHPP